MSKLTRIEAAKCSRQRDWDEGLITRQRVDLWAVLDVGGFARNID